TDRAELAVGVDHHRYRIIITSCYAMNACNKRGGVGADAYVSTNADRIRFPCNAGISNIDVVIACSKVSPGSKAQRSAGTAPGVVKECFVADCGVLASAGIVPHGVEAVGGIFGTESVLKKCTSTDASVSTPRIVAKQRSSTDCCVIVADGVFKEGRRTGGRV